MKKKVIFATTVFDEVNTGPGVYAQYLWQAFRDDPEIEFHIVAASFKEQHRRLHPVGSTKNSLQLYHQVAQKALELTKNREKETIVHGNIAHAMFDFVNYPGPWIVQINDYEAAEVWHRPLKVSVSYGLRRLASLAWRHRQESKVLGKVTRAVCNSDYTRQRILDVYGHANPDRVVRIHKAVDNSAFVRPDILPKDPIAQRPLGARLVFTGTHWQRKGLAELIKAVAIVAREFPHIHLTSVGPSNAAALRELRQLSQRSGTEDNILFAGRISREELAALYWHSNVFVLPSWDEAFGVAILEAMAAGLPVIATPVGGIPEIIRNETEGILCRPNNPNELAEAIRKLLCDEQLRVKLAQVGPKRAKEFDIAQMIKSVRQLYSELL